MSVKMTGVYALSVAMLAAAWLTGREVQQSASVADIKLDALPRSVGPWQCTQANFVAGYKQGETAHFIMEFRNDQGVIVEAIFSVTRTRLGSLRDWSLARMGQGWVLGEEVVWQSPPVDGLPFPITAGARWLAKDEMRRVCINWYVSPPNQSPSFIKAELLGWRDRLVGRDNPWGEMYVVSVSQGRSQDLWDAVTDLTVRLAPHFYELLSSTARS
jgi:hypothetical protein